MTAWAVGHLTVDDVVLPDGRTQMRTIGGAVTYAVVGAALVGPPVGAITRVCGDFPDAGLRRLRASGLPLHVTPVAGRCLSQWAIYEKDGSRTFLPHPEAGGYDVSSPRVDEAPPWTGIHALHLAPMPVAYQRPWVEVASRHGALITLDPHHDSALQDPDDVLPLLPSLTAFLPSALEASQLGGDDPVMAAQAFVARGARVAVVKLGADGSVLATADGVWHVPACQVDVTDPTGAGDAYCGAFLAALGAGRTALDAALHGTVAASLTVEHCGALTPLRHVAAATVRRRLERLEPRRLTRPPIDTPSHRDPEERPQWT